MNHGNYQPRRISQTATIFVHGNIGNIFPLFGAFEEKKWALGWEPHLIYPETEIMEEDTTFKTPSDNPEENHFLWIVTHFEPSIHFVKYVVSTENRYWTISVKCLPLTDKLTSAEITYAYTALNFIGDKLNCEALQAMYKSSLKDWEYALNNYLETGKIASA